MQPVVVSVSATDNCRVAPCKIVSVTSSELPDAGNGSAASDWEITGDLTLNLRAERSGTGTGRVYTVTVECADDSGNFSAAAAHVTVPHSISDVPAPILPKPVLTLRRGGSERVLFWRAISNRTYRVQYAEDLSGNAWRDLPGDVIATGDTASKTDTTPGGAKRFYRVVPVQ
jgi:hypothetical protein